MKIVIPNKLDLSYCSVVEDNLVDGDEWSSTATYSEDYLVRYDHVTYRSTVSGNQGNRPDLTYSGEDNKWQKMVATMPYRMLDDFVETQTEAEAGQNLVFTIPYVRADAIALLNLEGASVHIELTDSEDNEVVFEEDVDLQNDIENLSLYEYYFSPIDLTTSYVNTSLAMTVSGTITITITPSSSDHKAKIGHVVIGRKRYIGETKYDANIGITDYSKKVTDEFGITTFVKRSSSKSATLSLFVPAIRSDKVIGVLDSARSMPILAECGNLDNEHRSLVIFGWIEDWRMVYVGPNENEISVEIQGLI